MAESHNKIEEIEVLEINAIETLPVTVDELREATLKDDTVKHLVTGLETGKVVSPNHRFNINQTEFTLQNGCILRGLFESIKRTTYRPFWYHPHEGIGQKLLLVATTR